MAKIVEVQTDATCTICCFSPLRIKRVGVDRKYRDGTFVSELGRLFQLYLDR